MSSAISGYIAALISAHEQVLVHGHPAENLPALWNEHDAAPDHGLCPDAGDALIEEAGCRPPAAGPLRR